MSDVVVYNYYCSILVAMSSGKNANNAVINILNIFLALTINLSFSQAQTDFFNRRSEEHTALIVFLPGWRSTSLL